ncbi:MAG: indole-3-glycerol-phosphate synthase [Coriobacteriia bacterium]|nr:indole-3-glycerol-phosphate synthase [Coriobacteriia bacterium]
MATIHEMADYAQQRVEALCAVAPLDQVKESALTLAAAQREGQANDPCPARDETPRGPLFGFGSACVKPTLALIGEIKKASPTQGVLDPAFKHVETAKEFAAAGVDALCCWTEPQWYLGSENLFATCRLEQGKPMLLSDIIVSEYQIYQAKLLGAQAVSLSASVLDAPTIATWIALCDQLGLDAVVQASTPEQMATADAAGARIIGINNRSLTHAAVDFSNAQRLRKLIPWDVVYVAQSGMKNAQDVALMALIGADAVVIGEALMRSANRKALLEEFRSAAAEAVGE